ncbi:MAG: hypothetical protein LC650_03820 [Actinobacteria bacterium]|nr:hypothetical protein [Actinomycetota bacterium]
MNREAELLARIGILELYLRNANANLAAVEEVVDRADRMIDADDMRDVIADWQPTHD